MSYERPAVEKRIKVAGPVITAVTATSPVTFTPAWATRDALDGAGEGAS